MTFRPVYALATALVFIIEVLIALYMHDAFIRPYGGDILAVILVYLGLGHNRLLRIVLGGVFDVQDLACYAVGAVIAWGFEIARSFVASPRGD